MTFVRTTAVNKIRAMKARKKVIQGGTSAGKTYGIIPDLIDMATRKPGLKITVVAETIPAVRNGAVDIFKQVMQETGRFNPDSWISNPMQYTFSNGTRVQFTAFDTPGKAAAAGKRDILFLNECNNIPFPIADALMIRSKETYMDFNPVSAFWAHHEVLTEHNSEFLSLTYKDNEALPPETLEDLLIKKSKAFHDPNLPDAELLKEANIKSSYWANWWKVYGMGLEGSVEGLVFPEYDAWFQVPEMPADFKYNAFGLDFGYTNDPTAVVEMRYVVNSEFPGGALYFDELIYQTRMTNRMIYNRFQELGKSLRVECFADSAEPKSIDELYGWGWNVKKATKGPDSVKHGIDVMKRCPIFVTQSSTNLIKELRRYRWAVDKEGNEMLTPEDAFNHAIDAARYAATMKLGIKQGQNYGTYTED